MTTSTFDNCMARARVARALEGLGACFTNEDDLQQAVSEELYAAGIDHQRERQLGKAGRIDLLTTDGVGIECKISGSLSSIVAQLLRYLDAPECRGGVVLVTTKPRHRFVTPSALAVSIVLLTGGIR